MHIPVLEKEILEALDPQPNENFIDATIGQAGHSLKILEKNGPNGKLLGIDQTPEQIEITREKTKNFENRIILECGNFSNLKEIAEKNNFGPANGILFDLGFSSWHVDESGKGFTFQKDEPLLMNYGQEGLTAEQIVNQWSEEDLEMVLSQYGQERFSRQIARQIVEKRRIKAITTTFQLIEAIQKAMPRRYQNGKIHFATRTFQGLRIATNQELEILKKALPQAIEMLAPGGRLAIISFHSLEDRIVKIFLKEEALKTKIKILTKKPIVPGLAEIRENPRSRSAKLRAARKI
ncbi:MAG: 16S rRNA (cytosine(1402)-N(4))-methyltransferase RsmH [Candidatus Paceibacterota bacterium]|jgi:16S rRNA (cytosine1402-N4)-methyltransferase